MRDKVRKTIARYQMFEPGDSVLVALSGGADSTALLLVLSELKEEFSLSLAAAHVNHGIRGPEADRDEAFCRALCARLDIPLFVEHFHVPALAKERGLSLETCAREVRYGYFQQLRNSHGFLKTAVAHTSSDNVETTLFHLARGTGAQGLCGIPPVNGPVVRPLLFCTRSEIETYLAGQNQEYVMDSTNLDQSCSRNRIRHTVIPALTALNPDLSGAVRRMQQALCEDQACLMDQARGVFSAHQSGSVFSMPTKEFTALPPAIQKRVLVLAFGRTLSFAQQEELCHILSTPGKSKTLYGLLVSCGGGRSEVEPAQILTDYEIPLCGKRGSFLLPGTKWLVEYEVTLKKAGNEDKIHRNFLSCPFNYDKIYGTVVARPRRTGDCYPPLGFPHSRTVKKMMQEQKIPRVLRGVLPVFTAGSEVLWAAGCRPNHFFCPNEETREVLVISIREAP